jgi:multidrug efflux pump subunit AcrA (membrane-fusion protein)
VDVGQTVSASMSAPTLFVIAADLSRDAAQREHRRVGSRQRAAEQPVTFRVDAYPSDTFRGRCRRSGSNPTTVQNVVTYAAIIDAPNPALKLKPGMTANVTIEVRGATTCSRGERRRCGSGRTRTRWRSTRRASRPVLAGEGDDRVGVDRGEPFLPSPSASARATARTPR